jgi:hypothetical protein
METTSRVELTGQLKETRDTFLAGVSGITEAQAKFKPAPDRWSIEECAEHLALVESGLLARLAQEWSPSERIERPERQLELRELGMNREIKRQAPQRVHPTGRFGSLSKALEQFVENREKTIAYLGNCQDDLHARTVAHPIATMTCHELVVMMAGHTLRHLAQIREIRAAPGYPS